MELALRGEEKVLKERSQALLFFFIFQGSELFIKGEEQKLLNQISWFSSFIYSLTLPALRQAAHGPVDLHVSSTPFSIVCIHRDTHTHTQIFSVAAA